MRADEALAGVKLEPYWWEAAPRPDLPEVSIPERVDVTIVGSGYTGLNAALTIARAGRSVLVLDREAAGAGASSRNQGHIGASFKRGFAHLANAFGEARTVRILQEGQEAVEHCKRLVEEEQLDCRHERHGRFIAACSAAHFEGLARETELRKSRTGLEADVIPRQEMSQHIGSERYWGGVLLHREAGLHGAMFHASLLRKVREAGVLVAAHTEALRIERLSSGFSVLSARGAVLSRDVIVATNGYTGPLTPALRRRIVPINSFGIATEPLAPARLNRLLPGRRPCIDTLKLSHGFRIAPGEDRLIFGTRPPVARHDLRRTARHLRSQMLSVFPDLGDLRITHAWTGFVAFPFEMLPHIGTHDGIHYALGYCGYGVSLAPYLGRKLGLRVLGDPEGDTVFAELPFPTRPLYFGRPWFLSALLLGYRWQDLRTR